MAVFVVSVYLIAASASYITALAYLVANEWGVAPDWLRIGLICTTVGGLGGCMYCLRAVYLNYSVHRRWGNEWIAWYALRPIVSAGSGAISYVFLKAGLLILESGTRQDASEVGFYALAFIAGLNVDKFVSKLEDIAQAVWGIEKSRTSKTGDGGTGTGS